MIAHLQVQKAKKNKTAKSFQNLHVCFRSIFAYFDEKRCRWETEKNSCDDDVTDTDEILSDETESEIDFEDGGDASDIDTSVDGEITSNDVADVTDSIDAHTTQSTDLTNETTLSQNLQCEPLDETWMCSSGSRNLSLCVKFCTLGLDLSPVLSFNVILNHFTAKIQKRWPNRTQKMFVQAEKMFVGSKK